MVELKSRAGQRVRAWSTCLAAAVVLAGLTGTATLSADWPLIDQLTAFDGSAADELGVSSSISGGYAIVGAPKYDTGAGVHNKDKGAAYVYKQDGDAWDELTKLLASDGGSEDFFGSSVSISGDYAVVGAPRNDGIDTWAGAAYVFERSGSNWNQVAKLVGDDTARYDLFGGSVAISGNFIIVGANGDDDSFTSSGSAYIFERSGGVWSQAAKLNASDPATADLFGLSVAIDGNYAVIGARGDDDNGSNSGSAYVFKRTGTAWNQASKLTAGDGGAGDEFGGSVAISGGYAVVGAHNADPNGAAQSGAAYVFARSGSAWNQSAKLIALDGTAGDEFGISVAIDGAAAIVGAYKDDPNGSASGSVYAFRRSGSDWNDNGKITAPDGEADDKFGQSVGISGGFLLVGANGWDGNDDGNLVSNPGAAYVFESVGAFELGDLNGDGSFDNVDITPFVFALTHSQAAFEAEYPTGEFWAGDIDEDGSVDNLDIVKFVELLTGGGASVPEPGTIALLAMGAVLACVRRRKARASGR